MPMPDRMQIYNLLTRIGPSSVFTPEFLAGVDPARAASRTSSRPSPRRRQRATLNRMLAYDWQYTLADNDLPKVTGTATLAGVDVGFPLLDDRLLDFSLGLPPAHKLRGRKLRWFFKEALRGFLPDEIIAKKKHGFGLPFGVWLMRDRAPARARPRRRSTRSRHAASSGRSLSRTLFDERIGEHAGYYGEMVWILMMLEQWLARRVASGQRIRERGLRIPAAMSSNSTACWAPPLRMARSEERSRVVAYALVAAATLIVQFVLAAITLPLSRSRASCRCSTSTAPTTGTT